MEIGQLLDIKLKEFADSNGLKVAFENVSFSKEDKFLEGYLVPAETYVSGLNRESESGFYQVNLHYPLGTYRDEVDSMTRKLMDHFKTGSKTGEFRHLPSTSRIAGVKGPTHYSVAVTIHYRREKRI